MAPPQSGSNTEDEECHGHPHSPPTDNPITYSPLGVSPTSPTNPVTVGSRGGDSRLCLKSHLDRAFLQSEYSTTHVKFLPLSAVNDLIDHDSVREYWKGLSDTKLHKKCPDVINYVCGHPTARFVFSIIVLINEPQLLLGLIGDKVSDSDIPLCPIPEAEGVDFQLARSTNPTTPLKCFMKWTPAQRRSFDELQRQVKVEVLKRWPLSLPVYELPNRGVLPFTKCETIHEELSRVDRVEIHHAHHRFCNGSETGIVEKPSHFALKVLEAKNEASFALEVKALMKIKPKPHLANAVTAFKYQGKYHLIFNWAEGGNLADFWETEDPVLTHSSICWFAQQCHGLADGLDGIHNASISREEVENDDALQESSQPRTSPTAEDQNQIHGRHGDIKPQNILWFRDQDNEYRRGVLKIADFGVTAFHTARTTKATAAYVPVTRTYAAPEIDVSESDSEAHVSRPFDIWSLGCVYLEFIVWFLLGYQDLKKFAEHRMEEKGRRRKKFKEDNFYSVHKRLVLFETTEYATVKKSVNKWIDTLRHQENCSPFFQEFLDYIQEKMLVDKQKREKSAMVRETLGKMFERCKHNTDYALTREQTKVFRWREGSLMGCC